MKTSKVISRESQEHFWDVVRACLREFHHAPRTVVAKVSKLRREIEGAPITEIELFFHSEPFHVACGIAGRRLPMEQYLQRYLEIRDGQGKQDQTSRAV